MSDALDHHASYAFADFQIDPRRRTLLKSGRPVTLNPKTFELLVTLVEHNGAVLTKDDLLDLVWPGQAVEENNLTVHMSALRKVLGERRGEHKFVVTIPGRGYCFVAEVRRADAEARAAVIERRAVTHIVVEEEREVLEDETPGGAAETHAHATAHRLAPSARVVSSGRTLKKYLPVVALAGAVLCAGLLAVRQWRPGGRRTQAAAWRAPTQAMEPRQLTANGRVQTAALSPDGNYFVYAEGQTERPALWFGHTSGNREVQLRPPAAVTYRGLAFSPDGERIYYVQFDEEHPKGALFRLPILGGAPQRVLSHINSPVTFSPDGGRIAFVRNDATHSITALVVADAASGANERTLATRSADEEFSLYGPSWSPDGRLIAVGVRSGAQEFFVQLVDAADGRAERLGAGAWRSVRRIAWLRDGSGLFVNVREQDNWEDRHLWLLDYPGGEAHKITRDLQLFAADSLSISDDGTRLLSVGAHSVSNVFVGPADAPVEARPITTSALGKRDGANGLAWAPDGRIVYTVYFDKSETLWVMDADGQGARQLTPPGTLDRGPSVTPDGRHVLFYSVRDGVWNVWRVGLDGSGLRRLTTDGGARPSVTPDGRWLFYVAGPRIGYRRVWKVPFEGGEPVRLTEAYAEWVSISPDGASFVCDYREESGARPRLAVYTLDGGEPTAFFELAAGVMPRGIRWSPDGSAIFYKDGGSTLWRQPLAGGPPEKALDLPGRTVFAFDWSPDRTRMALAHGESLREVILISNERGPAPSAPTP